MGIQPHANRDCCCISLSILDSQAIAFIGRNSAGRSTIIKMLTSILQRTSRTVKLWICYLVAD
ncbi:ATP-binding cassette domain-containing protein [Nostocaceae cyanobacterium CENA369]|uniref:ATP-binding cassette domain-containing protein n=1 Tax=Dendronalium phyllosphericum CENA369 TaxID=1725256 RepID=A0A8J7LGX1_9NOST|nr:ATP-binding cassette domain-containing protein [Dendronalium phyllosphericum CENA369]